MEYKGLVGKKFKTKADYHTLGAPHGVLHWTISDVYANFVVAERIADNGCIVRECFDRGDLVRMGIIYPSRHGYDAESEEA